MKKLHILFKYSIKERNQHLFNISIQGGCCLKATHCWFIINFANILLNSVCKSCVSLSNNCVPISKVTLFSLFCMCKMVVIMSRITRKSSYYIKGYKREELCLSYLSYSFICVVSYLYKDMDIVL